MIRARIAWVLISLMILCSGAYAGNKAEKNFKKLSQEILQNLQEFWPVQATAMGVHLYDDRFTDYSSKSVNDQRKKLRNYLARLYKYRSVKLPKDMDINRRLVRGNCEMAVLRLLEFPYHKKNPAVYLGDASDGLYLILIQDYVPLSQRLDHIIGRMRALSDFLRQGEANLKDPPPIWLDYARENVDEIIDFYQTVGNELIGQFPDRADEIRTASDQAIAALNHFKSFLADLPSGEEGSFAIGKEYFDYILQHEYFFDFDSDSLLKIGEKLFTESMTKYREYEKYLDSADLLADKPMYVPRSITREDVFNYYSWEIEAVKPFFAAHNLVTIPDDIGECIAVETPEFLRGVISSIAYQPAGAFDAANTGYFYVYPLPDTLSADGREYHFRRMTERRFMGSVVHEAYPGHHLQQQLAARVDSDVRRWQMNNELIEGWALYCEELAYESGLYKNDPLKYWYVLRGIAFRAARIIVDAKLQTGQFSYAEAYDWMVNALEIDNHPFVLSEVLRYSMDPGQPMSYLMGKMAIMELRDEVKARDGENFDLKSFHDRLLAEGSIPVSIIREKMLE